LVPCGTRVYLTQLLDLGHFHADPHPGNLLVTPRNELCILDFGLCADVGARIDGDAIASTIFHVVHGNAPALIEDLVQLGFLEASTDTRPILPLLEKIFRNEVDAGNLFERRKKKLTDVSDELNDVFFALPFTVPAYYALITRALIVLEGIALKGDPEFDIFRAAYPVVMERLLRKFGPATLSGAAAAVQSVRQAVHPTTRHAQQANLQPALQTALQPAS